MGEVRFLNKATSLEIVPVRWGQGNSNQKTSSPGLEIKGSGKGTCLG